MNIKSFMNRYLERKNIQTHWTLKTADLCRTSVSDICPGDHTAVLYFSTKSVKIVVNPNNDIPFTAVSWQLNIERSRF